MELEVGTSFTKGKTLEQCVSKRIQLGNSSHFELAAELEDKKANMALLGKNLREAKVIHIQAVDLVV